MTEDLRRLMPAKGRNAILDALAPRAGPSLQTALSEIDLDLHEPVALEEEGVEGLYFPISCLLCRQVSLPEGTTVKVSIAGREGMVGSSALVQHSVSAFRTIVQLPGRALFLARSEAENLLRLPGVAPLLFRYLLLQVREASLTAACNRAHRARNRLARWLLLIVERTDLPEFPLTHESLAAMLGVRRESVTLAANELRAAGAIEYRRANVQVRNISELKNQTCSCYPAVTESYVRFLTRDLQALS
jgi:CRP-like cAMP-binding protein